MLPNLPRDVLGGYVFYICWPTFVARSLEDNLKFKAMALEADTTNFWLGMKWNGTLMTDIQGNALTYSKWRKIAPATPIAVRDQCLAYWRNLEGPGHFSNAYPCDSGTRVPTMCVWIMSLVDINSFQTYLFLILWHQYIECWEYSCSCSSVTNFLPYCQLVGTPNTSLSNSPQAVGSHATCQLPPAHWPLPTATCQLPHANYHLPTANCLLPTATCKLPKKNSVRNFSASNFTCQKTKYWARKAPLLQPKAAALRRS